MWSMHMRPCPAHGLLRAVVPYLMKKGRRGAVRVRECVSESKTAFASIRGKRCNAACTGAGHSPLRNGSRPGMRVDAGDKTAIGEEGVKSRVAERSQDVGRLL